MHTYLCFNSTTSVTNRAVELEFRDAECHLGISTRNGTDTSPDSEEDIKISMAQSQCE